MPPRAAVFLAFLAPYVLSYFFRSTNAVIVGDLSRDAGLGPEQLGLMTGFYFATFALAQLPIGPALDRFGPRKTVSALLVVAALGSLVFSTATSLELLALGRALIGLGVAGVLVGALKAFTAWYPVGRFATVSGVFVSLGASGALLATSPLVALKGWIGWRAVFWLGAGFTLLAAALLWRFGRDAPPGGHAQGEGSAQGRLREVWLEPRFWQVAFLNFALVGSFFSYQSLWLGPYLSEHLGLGEVPAGNLLLVLGLGVVAGYFASGWLADRLGLARTVAAAAALFFASQLVLAALRPGVSAAWLGLVFALFGLCGAFNVLLFAHARRLFPAHLSGRALALVNLFGMGGVALMQWLLGVGLARWESYSSLLWATGALGFVSLAAYLPLLARKQG